MVNHGAIVGRENKSETNRRNGKYCTFSLLYRSLKMMGDCCFLVHYTLNDLARLLVQLSKFGFYA